MVEAVQIKTYSYLGEFERVHVQISEELFLLAKDLIKYMYGGISKYSQLTGINRETLKWEFKKNTYHPFWRLLKICNDTHIPENFAMENISGFYHWGSHRKQAVHLPKTLSINEFFAEGYALYLAEGDNGFNGAKRPRKFRFTNSEISVINRMIDWTNAFFPEFSPYIVVISPKNKILRGEETVLNCEDIRYRQDSYNRIIKYRICIDCAILIDLVLSIEQEVKDICKKDSSLAKAYVRGMMIGEGTVYYNRSRYVRIEMKNEKEIRYIHNLLEMLGYKCKMSLRTKRKNMWSIYIGAGQLNKFVAEIGFGVHTPRQEKLERAAKGSFSASRRNL